VGLKFNPDFAAALTLTLQQTGHKAVDGVAQVMREGGEEIAELAKDYAPYDASSPAGRGHLQDAIEVKTERTGINGRLVVTVWVNGNRLGNGGKRIGEYAFLMHEFLAPYGNPAIFHAGPGTLAKGSKAGGKFLERAYRDTYKSILQRAAERARAILSRRS
jgi:hypothetical protein